MNIDLSVMTHKDIECYPDLDRYIKQEIKNQLTTKKKTAEIKLDEVWFFKAAKYIQFILKYEPEEHDARTNLRPNLEWFRVKANGVQTTFRRI